MQRKQQALACIVSASEDRISPRGEGCTRGWLLRVPLEPGQEQGPTFTSTNPVLIRTFHEDEGKAERLTSPPLFSPPKRVLLLSCKHCYQVFINSALDECLQIFSCFTARQATDIHRLWPLNVPNLLKCHLKSFLIQILLLRIH